MHRSVALFVAVAASLAIPASAQDVPRAAVLETQVASGTSAEIGGAADRMIRARLDGLGVVTITSGVSLDLSDVQLALGCVGESAECLGPVADELSVQLLVVPQLDRSGDALLLTLTRFDRRDGSIRRVVREARGENASTDLLEAVEGQLRELFGLPAVVAVEEAEPVAPVEPLTPPLPRPAPRSLRAGAWVLLGVGAASLAVGIGLGVAHLDAQSEWNDARPMSAADSDAAHDAFDRAESLGIGATVLYVVGGLALAAGDAWLIAELVVSGDASVAVAPVISPDFVGLAARGRLDGAR